MKLGAITTAAALLLVAGCSSGSGSAHKTPSSADNQAAYISAVRSQLGLREYTDKQLSDIAHSECKMLHTGSSEDDVIDVMADSSAGDKYDRAQLAYWVGAAKGVC